MRDQVHQGQYKKLQMLPRDWELLAFIEEQGFASFGQLENRFFNGKSNCSKRLKKLSAFGYIDRKRLFEFFKRDSSNNKPFYFPHILNLNVNPNDFIYFIGREYSQGFGKSAKLFKPSMILHQLILSEVRMFLEREIEHKFILNDPKLKILSSFQFGRNEEIVPDLSLEYDKVKIAIEVERTPKGMVRYFNRFNFFRDSIYTHVVYYYTDECQLRPLLKRAGSTNKFAFAHYKFPNELYSNVYGIIKLNDFIHRILGV